MKIYTKTGDDGTTGLYGAARVSKDDPRIETCGNIDELNAVLGMVRVEKLPYEMDALLQRIQNHLFDIGAEIATPEPLKMGVSVAGPPQIAWLESSIDSLEGALPELKQFILPGGTRAAAEIHLARTVCRRAERRLISLMATSTAPVSAFPIIYLNRLSDLLFVLARSINQQAGVPDTPWEKS